MLKMLGLAAAASAVLVGAGYHSMAPRSQLYGRTFIGHPGTRQIALTYDDGPNDPFTLKLLDVLSRYNVKATFFLIGKYVDQRPDIARELIAQGHVVGNHTYTHPNLIFRNTRQVKEEIARCDRSLRDAVGDACAPLFRPPFGGRRPATLRTVRAAGLSPVMWSVTGYDWNAKSTDAIERTVAPRIRGGDVILLHDGGHLEFGTDRSFTVQATERLISRFHDEGYEFVTISQMYNSASQLSASIV